MDSDSATSSNSSIREALLAILPILLFGLSWVSHAMPETGFFAEWTGFLILPATFVAFTVSLAGMARGWSRGFPRWSLPYVGASVIFSFYFSQVTTPGLRPFGIPVFGRELWGLRAWVPIILVSCISGYRAFYRVDWATVQSRFRKDWTLVLFGVYGSSHMLVGFMFDEIKSAFLFPATILGISMLAVGGVAYMLARTTWGRCFALGASSYLTILFASLFSAMYWDGRQEFWMKAPANGMEEFIGTAWWAVGLLTVVAVVSWIVAKVIGAIRLESGTTVSN